MVTNSRLLFKYTDSSIYEIKTGMSIKILAAIKKCLTLVIIQQVKIL